MSQILDLSAIRFLVVDDDAIIGSMVKEILRILGARDIQTAEGAAEGLNLLKAFEADIIITDWMMEPIDGIEFTRMLRSAKSSPAPMIPIIMLTSFSEKGRVSEARDAGVTEFMVKPISPNGLYLRIAEIISNPRQFVRTTSFYGPDRHRHFLDDDCFIGPQRRETDEEVSSDNAEPGDDNEPAGDDLNKQPQTSTIRED